MQQRRTAHILYLLWRGQTENAGQVVSLSTTAMLGDHTFALIQCHELSLHFPTLVRLQLKEATLTADVNARLAPPTCKRSTLRQIFLELASFLS